LISKKEEMELLLPSKIMIKEQAEVTGSPGKKTLLENFTNVPCETYLGKAGRLS